MKGEYGPEQEKVMEEQQALSRVFIKITATKVNAAYSRLVDLLFAVKENGHGDTEARRKEKLFLCASVPPWRNLS